MFSYPSSKPLLAAVLLAASLSGVSASAASAPLVLDDFSSPTAPVAGNPTGAGAQFFDRTFASFAGVAGQVREVTYNLYSDPSSSGALLSLGGAAARVDAGPGALGEFLFDYGAFTRPSGNPAIGGPNLGLDLSAYNDLQAVFSGVGKGLNVVVTLFTRAPHLMPNGQPLYYLESGVNMTPATPGGPMTADLFFDSRNPIAGTVAPYFNFSQVDGIFFEIDRSGFAPGDSYALDTLQFTQAVPEPAAPLMLLAGLVLLAAFARRRV